MTNGKRKLLRAVLTETMISHDEIQTIFYALSSPERPNFSAKATTEKEARIIKIPVWFLNRSSKNGQQTKSLLM